MERRYRGLRLHPSRILGLRGGGADGRRSNQSAQERTQGHHDRDHFHRRPLRVHDICSRRFASSANGVPWDGLANSVSIVFWLLVLLAIINSTLANAIAGTNVFTRTAYAFGRVGAFPKALGHLNAKRRSPQNAIVLQLILGLIIGLGLGAWKGPTMAFGIVATALVVVVVLVYLVTNLACIGYYTKHRRDERHPVMHIVFPLIGFVFLLPGFFNAAGITGLPGLKFIVPLAAPLSYGAWAMAVWMIIGVVFLLVLRSNNAEALEAVAVIHE
jgi:amino acid transporter